jgi:mannitol 2-dehydrogenase
MLRRGGTLSLAGDIIVPSFDIRSVTPGIVHIGLGGFHRSHFARYTHDLMEADAGALRWGIVGSGLRASDRPLLDALSRQDGLYVLVERDARGEKRSLIGSIVGVIDASTTTTPLLAAIALPQTKIVSITVSEAGYYLDPATKKLAVVSPSVAHDIANPHAPRTTPGILVEAYRQRRDARLPAFTALSCDNIQHNGRVLRDAVLALAREIDRDLAGWIEEHARFPSSMVDRITPVPTRAQIEAFAAKTGVADEATLFCESFRQWVIEDDFAAGRPDWSQVGVQFMRDVAPYEAMKLRLLNASHLEIAGLGALSGYETVEQTMSDPAIRRYMMRLMTEEIEPLLAPVPGIDLEKYKATLVERFANPAIRDTVKRINTDAAINLVLDPIRDALAAGAPVNLLSLALASWCARTAAEVRRGDKILGANSSDELERCARESSDDPARLLSVTSLFGDLGRSPRLTESVGVWLGKFAADGISQVLLELTR